MIHVVVATPTTDIPTVLVTIMVAATALGVFFLMLATMSATRSWGRHYTVSALILAISGFGCAAIIAAHHVRTHTPTAADVAPELGLHEKPGQTKDVWTSPGGAQYTGCYVSGYQQDPTHIVTTLYCNHGGQIVSVSKTR